MSLMDHVRSLLGASEHFDYVKTLRDQYDQAEGDQRQYLGEQIAARWDAIADECAESRPTALLFESWTVDEMREMAAQWRTGRAPE